MLAWLVCLSAWALLALAALACTYYIVLALYALVFPPKPRRHGSHASTDFAILIPAHDEAQMIQATLKRALELDYPRQLFTVYVIADNCTDETAAVADGLGVEVLERTDTENRGKGFALGWGLPKVLAIGHDAVVVVDADCLLDIAALRHLDERLKGGGRVFQCANRGNNPDDSPESYAAAVGSLIENELFYTPKSKLGLSVLLGGTGMVFAREVLVAHPWDAHTIAEDSEYSIRLLKAGVEIHFVPEVSVYSAFPSDNEQLKVQRSRWAEGNLGLGKRKALGLIYKGIKEKNYRLADAGFTMLVISRPLVLGELSVALCVSAVAALTTTGRGGGGLLTASLFLVALQCAYFALGVLRLGLTSRRWSFLKQSPQIVYRLVKIALAGLFSSKNLNWNKTPRRGTAATSQTRVLHLIATNFYGGPEKQIVEHLSRLNSAAFKGVVCSFIEKGSRNEILEKAAKRGIEQFGIPMDGPIDLSALRGLRAALKSREIGILCMHGYKANVIGYLAAKGLPISTIAFSRGYTAEDKKVAFYEWLERKVIGRHDGIIAVSHGQLQRIKVLGVRPKRSWVVHNAVSIATAEEAQKECDPLKVRALLGVGDDQLLVICSGRLSREKGHRYLLDAIALLPEEHASRAVFVFCGEGVCRGPLEEQAAALGISDRCRFTGFRSDVLQLYSTMDLMALPSLTEGFPNVILEAFSFAKPVVATAVGGVPELVEDNVSGLLVAAGNPEALSAALVFCLDNPQTAKGFGLGGYETVREHFTFNGQNEKLEAIYKQLASGAGRAGRAARALVLTLHGVAPIDRQTPEPGAAVPIGTDDAALRYIVSEASFVGLLKSLDPGLVCTVDEFSTKTAGRWTVLTFDDGLATDYSVVFPRLLEAGLRATFYVNADNIGREGYTTEAELREMHAAGMEIGSHGCAHRYLPLLGSEESRHEIAASRALIGAVLGAPVTSYAPVGGHFTARDVKYIWEAGYSTFATMEPGVSGRAAGAAVLRRNHLLADDSPSRIGRIVKAWPPTLFYNRLRYLGLLLPKKILGLRGYDKLKGALLSKLSRGDGGPKR